MSAGLAAAEPVDPFTPVDDGVYRDGVVEVRRVGPGRPRRTLATVRTPHFDVVAGGQRVQVQHVLDAADVDDDLAGLLAAELFGPGWLRGPELFERVFTGVVRTLDPDPLRAWGHFYRNTLARIDGVVDRDAASGIGTGGHGTLAGYAPVWRHAAALTGPGRVLELGSCFGFFALRLASTGQDVTATDVAPGTVALLDAIAPTLGVPLRALVADAAHVPLPDRWAGTVIALHLLEHVDPEHGERVIAEAVRLARRRVVLAVPLEEVADETWGHVRTITLDDLRTWGRALSEAHGLRHDVHEHHGGWLVLDRPGPK